MLPLLRRSDRGFRAGDFVKVDCAACHNVALMTLAAPLRLGLSLGTKMLDLHGAARTSRYGQGFNLGAVADHRGRRCPLSGVRLAFGLPHRLVATWAILRA
jgi:hypothetical protein